MALNQQLLESVFEDCYSLHLGSIFYRIASYFPESPIDQNRDRFFQIIELWLREKRILFTNPATPLSGVWNEKPETIISTIKKEWRWPDHAFDLNHIDINLYFHYLPEIIWLNADGTIWTHRGNARLDENGNIDFVFLN